MVLVTGMEEAVTAKETLFGTLDPAGLGGGITCSADGLSDRGEEAAAGRTCSS